MFCSISGKVAETPAVCTKTGYLYERRIIEKVLQSNGGKCPHSDVEMSVGDLVEVRATKQSTNGLPDSVSNVESMLKHLQNEWDANVIEVHQLRKYLHSTRQELATALYRVDAAHRVIAKLKGAAADQFQHSIATAANDGGSEKNEGQDSDAGRALESGANKAEGVEKADSAGDATTKGGSAVAASQGEDVAVSTPGPGQSTVTNSAGAPGIAGTSVGDDLQDKLPQELWNKMQGVGLQLMTSRKTRTVSESWARSDDISMMSLGRECTVDNKGGAISCLVLGKDRTTAYVGLSSGAVKQMNLEGMKLMDGGCDAHKANEGGVSELWCGDAQRDVILSGGGDGVVRVWKSDWTLKGELKDDGAVVGVECHPEGSICLVGRPGSWSWTDVDSATTVARGASKKVSEYSSGAIHPDGMMFAMGCSDGTVEMWDVGNLECVHRLGERGGSVGRLAMSEKGYYMASCRDGTVELWDLRKRAVVGKVEMGEGGARGVALDGMGEFGCGVGDDVACLFAGKKKAKVVSRVPLQAKVKTEVPQVLQVPQVPVPRLGVAWGANAKMLFAGRQHGVVHEILTS